MKRERRDYDQTGVELRAGDGEDSGTITGLGAVYYDGTPTTEFRLFPNVVERIHRGFFSPAIEGGQDIRGLRDHDPSLLLGRTSAGTMSIRDSDRGPVYEITPAEHSIYSDTASMIRRGDLSGSSFGFHLSGDERGEAGEWGDWEETEINGELGFVRNLRQVDTVYDFGPVTFPAYTATTTGLRSIHDGVEASLAAFVARQRAIRNKSIDRRRALQLLEMQLGI